MSQQHPKGTPYHYLRTPSSYDGFQVTTKRLHELLPRVMQSLSSLYKTQPSLVLGMWPEVVGEKLAALTCAFRFEDGVMHVKVKNSTLLSLLNNPVDRQRMIEAVRKKVPGIVLTNIQFRIG